MWRLMWGQPLSAPRWWLSPILAVAMLLAGSPALAAEPGGVDSPTGRRPMSLWSPERQARWAALTERHDPHMANLFRSAALTGTKKQRYADLGQWAAAAYQFTGDLSFAQKAWSRIERKVNWRPTDRNFTREHLVEYAWMYDWLKPSLSDEQRRAYIAMMNTWCLLTLDRVPGKPFGTRVSDTDETVGHYMGLALWAAVSGAENPQAVQWLNDGKVGGYAATGTNRKTWRNAVAQFVSRAKGGVWLEGSKYNLGTVRILLFGAEAIRTATGHDYFPEITAFTDDAATAQIHELTSDLHQSYQWGDEEDPRSLHLDRRRPLLAMLTGLARDEGVAGRAHALLNELPDEGEIPAKETVLYNPYRHAQNWRNQPKAYAAEGVGMVFARDGWELDATFFGAHMASRLGIDHEVKYFGDFQLYRDGEWAVTHPLGYDATEADHINGMFLGGWSSMREARGLTHHGMTSDGICVVVGATGGHAYGDDYLAPPPYFLHEWTRSLVYVPSQDHATDLLIVHDRTHVQDPMKLPGFNQYRGPDQTRMKREIARGLKQWILHMPDRPAIQPRGFSWRTRQGHEVTVTTLLPERVTYQVYNERTDLKLARHVREGERKWQARVIPAEANDWDTFLHVIKAGNGPVQVTLVREKDREGVHIVRPGHPDRTIVFNAAPSPKLGKPKVSAGALVMDRQLLKRFKPYGIVEIR